MTTYRQKVLLVTPHPGGEPAVEKMLGRLAEQEYFDVEMSASPGETLARLRSAHPALIIVAATMPGTHCHEAAATIQSDARASDIPLLLIQSYSGDPLKLLPTENGAPVDYLFTPLIPELLQTRLRLFLCLEGKNQELRRQAAEFDELNHQLLAGAERDRHRLAIEVHDIISSLSACHLDLEIISATCGDEPLASVLRDRIEDASATLSDASTRLRQVCSELRPATLDYLGLLPTLEEYGRLFLSGSDTVLHLTGNRKDARLPPELELALFRIAQEALTNCARHARADEVTIDLAQSDGHIVLTIEDNGVGFDPQSGAQGHGLGLPMMRERAKSAGGTLTVQSRPGAGTRIRVEL